VNQPKRLELAHARGESGSNQSSSSPQSSALRMAGRAPVSRVFSWAMFLVIVVVPMVGFWGGVWVLVGWLG
jgi:hypothetical protein